MSHKIYFTVFLLALGTAAGATEPGPCDPTYSFSEGCPVVMTVGLKGCGYEESGFTVKLSCESASQKVKHRGLGRDYRLEINKGSSDGWTSTPGWKVTRFQAIDRSLSVASKPSRPVQAQIQVQLPPEGDRSPAAAVPIRNVDLPKPAPVEEDKVVFDIKGGFDAYYTYNFNKPRPVTYDPSTPDRFQPNGQNTFRAWDVYHDAFTVNLAEIRVKAQKKEMTLNLDLGFGTLAENLTGPDEVTKNVMQANVQYAPESVKGLTVTVGKMITHLGLEPIRPRDNMNYSRSIGFNYALPFFHVGAAATYQLIPDTLSASAYVYNGTYSAYEVNKDKMYGSQLNWAPSKKFNIIYGNLFGGETVGNGPRSQQSYHDLNFTWNITDRVQFATDVIKGTDTVKTQRDWFSWAVYGKYQFVPSTFSALRVEGFDDPDKIRLVPNTTTHLNSYTLTLDHELQVGTNLRFEVREDVSSGNAFTDSNNQPTNHQTTATGAVMVQF